MILVFCIVCIEVQSESTGLSMECVSPLFSGMKYDIELIVSMNDVISVMYNLRCRKSSTQDCTPPCNGTKEHHFRSNDSLSDVNDFF